MHDHDELLADFIAEAWESMDRLDQGVVLLEQSPDDQGTIANVFRAIHTIKGSSGFFGLKRIERLSHAAETLLGNLRDGRIALSTPRTNALLSFLDALRHLIGALEAHKREPEGDDAPLIESLRALSSPSEQDAEKIVPTAAAAAPEAMPQAQQSASPSLSDAPATVPAAPAQPAVDPLPAAEPVPEARVGDALAPVKVSVELLDSMVNNVSELVLARNRLLPYAQRPDDRDLSNLVATIDRLTQAMQEQVLKTRMQLIGQLWSRIPRLARDVAQSCGKEVQVVCTGQDTELDRAMLDALKDPVMHVVRNCIDHGIEGPQERLALGKPAQGLIRVDARHENGAVVVVLEDDGRGLDMAAIGRRALAKGLVSADALASLTDEQMAEFIFLPGFSTRDEVSEVSGRGVGMDVVRTNLSAVGGHIRLRSIWGHGTRCTLTVPLTLSIIPALLVQVGSEQYAMPQAQVRELLRHRPGVGDDVIEDFYGIPVLRRRDDLIAIYSLRQWVDLPERPRSPDEAWHIVVIEMAEQRFGLQVDEILNLQEVVIKPLPPALRKGSLFTGVTIQGDGRVALILDMGQLARRSSHHARLQKDAGPTPAPQALAQDTLQMLMVQIEAFGLSAIPMQYVWRLDKVSAQGITHRAGQTVLAYQGHVIRLLDLHGLLMRHAPAPDPVYDHQLDIVICRHGQDLVGLMVQHIVGTAALPQQLQQTEALQFGLLGMVLHEHAVVNVLNLPQLLHGDPAPAMRFEALGA